MIPGYVEVSLSPSPNILPRTRIGRLQVMPIGCHHPSSKTSHFDSSHQGPREANHELQL